MFYFWHKRCLYEKVQKTVTYVLFPITLLMFIWTVSCFKLMANTTNVSHGAPCWPAALPFLLKDGVDVFVTESEMKNEWRLKKKQSGEFCNFPLSLITFGHAVFWLLRGVMLITSPWSRGIRHTPGATRCGGLEVAQAARGHVASGGVLWKDVGGLGHVLCPSAAVPCPPVSFPAGLGGQMLGDVFGWVGGGGARGWGKVKVERCK